MQQFNELVNWLGDVAVQGWVTATEDKDNELIEWSDELIGAFTGIGGFFKAAKQEFLNGTAEQVDSIIQKQVDKLVDVEMPRVDAAFYFSFVRSASLGYMKAVKDKAEVS